ncbi:TIGR03943 family putative permease subunit [Agromyces bracchium]|uniref:TIGR03943 family protein n=1 Tax=Agromyces bracchium TaxID=88376 RepID=A0A6I3M8P8_9MICO|nr:TIGR03943 family protein [Agromyces bracchium]MTH66953.1 TIGR03943 family protein [Agromyces bracchium]
MLHSLVSRWKGVALTLVSVVAVLWLAATEQLGLYINPDYAAFTVVMTIIGGTLALAALALAPVQDDHEHHAVGADDEHEHEHSHHVPAARARRVGPARRRIRTASAIVIVAGAAVALLVLPPATLTARTAIDRDVEVTAAELAADAPSLAGADPSTFDISDWALIANQFDDPAEFGGIKIELAGFVSPVPGDPDDSFYITRFKITHCAIDARPVGVPVHLPGWREQFSVDDWVVGTGELAADPTDQDGLALLPGTVGATDEPGQPYVY